MTLFEIADFDVFWAAYPRRQKKADAMKAWLKLQPDAALLATMLDALVWQKNQRGWQDKQFIPLPGTWLRAEQFTDEPFESPSKPTGYRPTAEPDYGGDWWDECKRVHGNACLGRMKHDVQMAIDRGKQ